MCSFIFSLTDLLTLQNQFQHNLRNLNIERPDSMTFGTIGHAALSTFFLTV